MQWLTDCWCPKENPPFLYLKIVFRLCLADSSSKQLKILHAALSRSSWDLGSWSPVPHLFWHSCQVNLLCYRLHKGEKRTTNEKVWKRGTWNLDKGKVGLFVASTDSCSGDTSLHSKESAEGWPLQVCKSLTPQMRLHAGSSPPEGNKKGVCIPHLNFIGNGGITLLLAGERRNFHSKSGSSHVKSSTVKSHCTHCMAFYE